MKKKVNGQIVDVKNMEVFERAAEGLAANRTAISTVNDSAKVDMYSVREYVALYNAFYKSLPYPLYAIDTNVKYAVIANYIKKKAVTTHKMWVNNGLFICIDDDNKIAINFINSTWGIVRVESIKEDNTNIALYKSDCGFRDLIWALSKVLNKQSTSNYYNEFMSDFIKACNNQPLVLKWELGNILDFGRIPERYEFQTNKIIDFEQNKEYTLDIFVSGLRESVKKQQTWSFLGDDSEDVTSVKMVKQYGYEVYEKGLDTESIRDKQYKDTKLKKCELFGMMSIFNTLCLLKNINEANDFYNYYGFIEDTNLVYLVNNRLFIARSDKFVEPKEVARGVELYAFDRGMVFFIKSKIIAKGIKKETIYSYSIKEAVLRLCKIQFINT